MSPSRSWLVVPALGIACAAIALAMHGPPLDAIAVALCGAAITAVVRAFAGVSAAANAAAAIAALIGVLGLVVAPRLGHLELARAALACAAAGFAIAEIVRPMPPAASPWPAIGAAAVAGVLDPSFVALVAIAGMWMIRGPWPRPRWAAVVPVVGGLAIATAIGAAITHGAIWKAWTGPGASSLHASVVVAIGDGLGPITAIAAIAGLAIIATRGGYGAIVVVAVAACAIGVDLRTASFGAATMMTAALAAGVAIGRLAAMIRIPIGQVFVGVTAGCLMLVAPLVALI